MKPKQIATPQNNGNALGRGRRSKGKRINYAKVLNSKIRSTKKITRKPRDKNAATVEQLLERTAEDSDLNGSFTGDNSPHNSKYKFAKVSRKINKVRSYLNVNQHVRLVEDSASPSRTVSRRRKTDNARLFVPADGKEIEESSKQSNMIKNNMNASLAEDAMEVEDKYKKEVKPAKWWNAPVVRNGISYDNIQNGHHDDQGGQDKNDGKESFGINFGSCLIS